VLVLVFAHGIFSAVSNATTATALGITLLARADEVIE